MLRFRITGVIWFCWALITFGQLVLEAVMFPPVYEEVSLMACCVLCAWMGYGVFRKRLAALFLLSILSLVLIVLAFKLPARNYGWLQVTFLVFLSWTVIFMVDEAIQKWRLLALKYDKDV